MMKAARIYQICLMLFVSLCLILPNSFAEASPTFADDLLTSQLPDSVKSRIDLLTVDEVGFFRTRVHQTWLPVGHEVQKPVLKFHITDGRWIDTIQIIRSSGDEKFDQSAIQALLSVQPLYFKSLKNQSADGQIEFSRHLFNLYTDSPHLDLSSLTDEERQERAKMRAVNKELNLKYGQYVLSMSNKAKNSWRPKETQKSFSNTFDAGIDNKGSVLYAMCFLLSSNRKEDAIALEAILRAQPYKYPNLIEEKILPVRFTFDLNASHSGMMDFTPLSKQQKEATEEYRRRMKLSRQLRQKK